MEKLETDLGFPAGARGVTLGARGVAAGTVRVWLLGGVSVSVGGRLFNRSAWRLRKAASLVQLLALAPRHRLHKERVVDLLWPDLDAKRAANNLHRVLHVARGPIDPASSGGTSRHLTLRNGLIALNPDDQLWVDVEAFEGAAAMARRGRDPAAYRAAVTLYAGDLLPGDLYEPWAEDRREALRRLCLTLLTEMAALLTEREEYGPAIEALERVAIEDPTDEAACAGLMRLYAAEGRRLEALLRYERFSRTVAEKLGSRPTAASRRLYETIRAGGSPEIPHPPRPGAHPDEVPSNLPSPLSSFVGRRREMVEVNRSLSMTRLLTLTGMGGSGKTRLALEVARELLGAHPGGTWLAELAPLSDP